MPRLLKLPVREHLNGASVEGIPHIQRGSFPEHRGHTQAQSTRGIRVKPFLRIRLDAEFPAVWDVRLCREWPGQETKDQYEYQVPHAILLHGKCSKYPAIPCCKFVKMQWFSLLGGSPLRLSATAL